MFLPNPLFFISISLLILLVLIFNRIIFQLNINTISHIANKYGNDKIIKWINKLIEKGLLYNSRFLLFFFIFITIFLVIVSLFNIALCYELKIHIHDYVTVYNIIHKDNSSILIILSLTKFNQNKIKVLPSSIFINYFSSSFDHFNNPKLYYYYYYLLSCCPSYLMKQLNFYLKPSLLAIKKIKNKSAHKP